MGRGIFLPIGSGLEDIGERPKLPQRDTVQSGYFRGRRQMCTVNLRATASC